ncbi:hypothetical protein [Helicobacter sp. 13S00482-2]|uniref:hypothetical protein n=1 Tax=Helicobacter sp. 13S00482-2 TaxID=1476200 RepID=UPI00117BB916|nr:hypothetical protein [Helicobacter sp. 13S00482-2]
MKTLFFIFLMASFVVAEHSLIPNIRIGGDILKNPNFKEDNLEESLLYLENHIGGDSFLLEANLYELGSSDGKIKPDLNRSLKAYEKLYKQGNPIAAFKIGMFAWEIKKNPKDIDIDLIKIVKHIDGLDPVVYFKKGSEMNSNYRYRSLTPLLRKTLGIYIFSELKDYKKTIEIMSDPSVSSSAGAQIYLAFAYYELRNEKLANFFLNKACNNLKKGQDIAMFCMDSKAINRQNMGE